MVYKHCKAILFIIFISTITLAFCHLANAQTTYALIIIMNNDVNISPSVERDSETVQTSLKALEREQICRLEITVIQASDGKITKAEISSWLDDIYPSENDTVMIYYSGHGFIDEQNKHFLSFDEGNFVPRTQIIDDLNKVRCRLKILITDSCSNLVSLPTPITATSRSLGEKGDKEYYKNLFLQHEGIMDVTAASEGEYAWGSSSKGGYFTTSFFASFKGDGSKFRRWQDVLEDAKIGTKRLFGETSFSDADIRRLQAKRISGQNPKAYAIPNPIDNTDKMTDNYDASEEIGWMEEIKVENLQQQTSNDGSAMVLIPAGKFYMGIVPSEIKGITDWAKTYDQTAQASWFQDEAPRHEVYLDDFYIDVHEVTNEMYDKFIKATGYRQPKFWNDQKYNDPKQPVVGVTWDDAKAYCDWTGKRLPTEAEWEKAARGGLVDKKFPWGDNASHDYANYAGTVGADVWAGSAPVCKFAPNRYGLYDMAGNVFEWCADFYAKDYYSKSPSSNPKGPDTGTTRVVRGGGFSYSANYQRVSDRFGSYFSNNAYPNVGFRCAK